MRKTEYNFSELFINFFFARPNNQEDSLHNENCRLRMFIMIAKFQESL